jgi:tetratricopeptide (TPR) repeat protein
MTFESDGRPRTEIARISSQQLALHVANLVRRGVNLAAIVTASELVGSVRRSEQASDLFMLGVALSEKDRYEEAVSAFREALALKPDLAAVHCCLGLAFHSQGHFDQAVASYRDTLKLQPDYAEAYRYISSALQAKGELQEALAALRDALRLKPDYAEAQHDLGSVLFALGRHEQSIDAYRRAIRATPDYVEAYAHLGLALDHQGQYEDAIAAYRKAIDLRPGYYQALEGMWSAFCHRAEAEARAQKPHSLTPGGGERPPWRAQLKISFLSIPIRLYPAARTPGHAESQPFEQGHSLDVSAAVARDSVDLAAYRDLLYLLPDGPTAWSGYAIMRQAAQEMGLLGQVTIEVGSREQAAILYFRSKAFVLAVPGQRTSPEANVPSPAEHWEFALFEEYEPRTDAVEVAMAKRLLAALRKGGRGDRGDEPPTP